MSRFFAGSCRGRERSLQSGRSLATRNGRPRRRPRLWRARSVRPDRPGFIPKWYERQFDDPTAAERQTRWRAKRDLMPQQREVTHRFMILRFRFGATSIAISPRRSASLMAARALALPTLARSAIRATGRVHFPVAEASFRMTASTAIASIFRCSPIEGGTTTVAARNRRPHTTRGTVSDLLLFSTIRVSILD